ncbi:hypothetical protein CDL62_14940 [Alkalitalea saponilacus]|nr:hypothetical protein CDL62_14940 [Alkalitalea saponilacus]
MLTLVFFCLIVVGLSEKLTYLFNLNIDSIVFTWNELTRHSYAIPLLLNPVHELRLIFPEYENISFYVYLIDYFQKIVIAFFIFQVISAFRKYMK